MTVTFDRIPPQDLDAERATLGAMLLNPVAADVCADILPDPGAFYAPAHEYIYRAMMQLHNAGEPIDPIPLKDELLRAGHLEGAGGLAYIAEISGCVPTSANADRYAGIVRDKYTARQLISEATTAIQTAFDPPDGITSLTDDFQAKLAGIVNTSDESIQHVSNLTAEFKEHVAQVARGEVSPGLSTGISGLDKLKRGLRSGDYFVVAARPSVGKTAFALNAAAKVMTRDKEAKILIFSMEMDKEQLLTRLAQCLCSVNFEHLEYGVDVDNQFVRLDNAINIINETGLFIDDSSNPTIQNIVRKLRAFQTQNGNPNLIIIDYLQLMTSTIKFNNRNEELSMISRTIKAMVREMECPALVLSQFNREATHTKRPLMSQLRESGSIEQDADQVLILHPDDEHETMLHAYLDKHRNGATGNFTLRFDKPNQHMKTIPRHEAEAEKKNGQPIKGRWSGHNPYPNLTKADVDEDYENDKLF